VSDERPPEAVSADQGGDQEKSAGDDQSRAASCLRELNDLLQRRRCALVPQPQFAPPDGRLVVQLQIIALPLIDLPGPNQAATRPPDAREAKILNSIFQGRGRSGDLNGGRRGP